MKQSLCVLRHLGHAKSICLNFGLAREYNGTTHLRLDDTNPSNEADEYAAARPSVLVL